MYDIAALGEVLIDFTEAGTAENGSALFERNPGGAVANVLACAARWGHKAAFIGKVGADMHGVYLRSVLEAAGIDISGLLSDASVFTTLAFVELTSAGERRFSFARKPGADTRLTADELPYAVLRSTRLLHIGSLSLTDEPARSATWAAVRAAKAAGAYLSYDPNYRAGLWKSTADAAEQMRSVLPFVDLIKLSAEETCLLTDCSDPSSAVQSLTHHGISCAVVTLGAGGALVCVGGDTQLVRGYAAPVVDTTGAGDTFWAGFLHCMLQSGKTPTTLTLTDAAEFARWGNAAAALCIGKRGAIPAIPGLAEVAERL